MQRRAALRLPAVGLLAALLAVLLTAGHAPDSPVADAAMAGDMARVEALLADGADVSAPQGDGMTALHWAARASNAPLTRLLLGAGADVDATTRIGAYTALHLASEVGSAETVGLLLAAGAEQTATTDEVGGAWPLHLTAGAGAAEAVRLLLEHGGETDARERRWGQTPLMYAAARGREAAVRALLEGGADPNLATWVTDITALAEWSQADRRARSARMRGQEAPEVPPRPAPSDRPLAAGRDAPGARPEADEAENDYERPIEEPEPLGYGDLIGGHGGMTALLHSAREGHAGTVPRAPRGRGGHQPCERRRPHEPHAHRDDQRPLRPRDGDVRGRRRPPTRLRRRHDAAVRGPQRPMGAEVSLSAAARLRTAATRLSRRHAAPARRGRRPRRAPRETPVVGLLQLRPPPDRPEGRGRILARRLRARRGGHEADRRVRGGPRPRHDQGAASEPPRLGPREAGPVRRAARARGRAGGLSHPRRDRNRLRPGFPRQRAPVRPRRLAAAPCAISSRNWART